MAPVFEYQDININLLQGRMEDIRFTRGIAKYPLISLENAVKQKLDVRVCMLSGHVIAFNSSGYCVKKVNYQGRIWSLIKRLMHYNRCGIGDELTFVWR